MQKLSFSMIGQLNLFMRMRRLSNLSNYLSFYRGLFLLMLFLSYEQSIKADWKQSSFTVDNVCYRITSTYPQNEVAVTYDWCYINDGTGSTRYTGPYTGDVIIPEYVTDNSVTYTVTSIDAHALHGRSSVTSISLPNTIISIGQEAFRNCSGLTSITIPESVTSIGNHAFQYCIELSSIEVEIGNTTFDSRNNCNAIIEKATNTLITGCQNTIIPNDVTSIGNYAFYQCNGLTSITIPNSVTSIGDYAFSWCSGLTSVVSKITMPFVFGSYAFSGISSNCVLTVPRGTRDEYIARGWTESVFQGGIIEQVFEETIAVGSSGYATFCSPNALDFSEVTNIKAYIASGFNPATGILVLTRVTEVPGGEGLYIVGTPGISDEYVVPTTTTSMFYSNLLKGVTETTTIYPTEGDKTNFILANGLHGVGFYTLSEAGELAVGKAYLQLPTASVTGVKALNIILDDGGDDATGINIMDDVQGTMYDVYNLSGQRVNQPKLGLYIINGKKVFVK